MVSSAVDVSNMLSCMVVRRAVLEMYQTVCGRSCERSVDTGIVLHGLSKFKEGSFRVNENLQKGGRARYVVVLLEV